MLAALLVPVSQAVLDLRIGRLNELSEEELLALHRKSERLIKWITQQSELAKIYSEEKINELIKNEELIKLRNLLQVNDEEALIFILIASI